jgi:hypothetical protein
VAVISAQHIPSCCTVCTEQPQTNNKIMAKIKCKRKIVILSDIWELQQIKTLFRRKIRGD